MDIETDLPNLNQASLISLKWSVPLRHVGSDIPRLTHGRIDEETAGLGGDLERLSEEIRECEAAGCDGGGGGSEAAFAAAITPFALKANEDHKVGGGGHSLGFLFCFVPKYFAC